MIADFADPEDGGFFYTAGDHETLLARVKDPFDNALPGANSLAIRALVGLGVATGEARYLDEAGRALDAFAAVAPDPAGRLAPDAPGARGVPRRPAPAEARGRRRLDAPLPGRPGRRDREGRAPRSRPPSSPAASSRSS